MANGIIRIQKYQKNALQGVENHHKRKTKISTTNHDINYDLSGQNQSLIKPSAGSFLKSCEERIEKAGVKKVRSNSVVACEALVTASPDFFKEKDTKIMNAYFKRSLWFLQDFYGKENIISADVHLDESTPHMHVVFTPITVDNRLSARDLISKSQLQKLQDEFYRDVTYDFGLERGERGSKRKHLDTIDYKKQTIKKLSNKVSEKRKREEEISSEISEKARWIENADYDIAKKKLEIGEINLRIDDLKIKTENNLNMFGQLKKENEELSNEIAVKKNYCRY